MEDCSGFGGFVLIGDLHVRQADRVSFHESCTRGFRCSSLSHLHVGTKRSNISVC